MHMVPLPQRSSVEDSKPVKNERMVNRKQFAAIFPMVLSAFGQHNVV